MARLEDEGRETQHTGEAGAREGDRPASAGRRHGRGGGGGARLHARADGGRHGRDGARAVGVARAAGDNTKTVSFLPS